MQSKIYQMAVDGRRTFRQLCRKQLIKNRELQTQIDQLQARLKDAEELLNAFLRGESEDQLLSAIQEYFIAIQSSFEPLGKEFDGEN